MVKRVRKYFEYCKYHFDFCFKKNKLFQRYCLKAFKERIHVCLTISLVYGKFESIFLEKKNKNPNAVLYADGLE